MIVMKELIGIKSLPATTLYPSMKRELLMFDKVGIVGYSSVIQAFKELSDRYGRYLNDYDFLLDAGLIFEAESSRSIGLEALSKPDIITPLEALIKLADSTLQEFEEATTSGDIERAR
jgi:hypothetical protein